MLASFQKFLFAHLRVAGVTLVLVPVLFSAEYSSAQPEEDGIAKVRTVVTVRGFGKEARERALFRAELDAFALFLESSMDAESLRKVRVLYSRSSYYVHTSRIVSYDRLPHGTKVNAEVYIRTGPLRRDIASLLIPKFDVPPVIAIIVSEELVEIAPAKVTGEETASRFLVDLFEERGFDVVDPQILRARYSRQELLDVVYGESASIARFGRENRADVVIAGPLNLSQGGRDSRSNSFRVEAELRLSVVRVSDSLLIEVLHSESVVNGFSVEPVRRQAILDACAKVEADALTAATLGHIHDIPVDDVWLTLEASSDWRGQGEILEALRGVTGIGKIEALRPSDGAYHFRLEYEGAVRDLVHSLVDARYSSFRLEPSRVVGREVVLRSAELRRESLLRPRESIVGISEDDARRAK